MNECTLSVRRTMCVAVLLAAAGLYGCGAEDAPADDRFRHAHVLASEFQTNVSSAGPAVGWTPIQFQTAYNLSSVVSKNYKPLGYAAKVAVIVAYHYANLQSDLDKWCAHFNLAPIHLNIINQAGNVHDNSWALEAAINVQMLNAVSPGATVYVIEAKSESQADVRTAMLTAQNLGVDIVAMPFGASEPGSAAFAAPFAPSPNLVWIAASGDSGRPSFPATHPGVIAVGGTVAQLNSNNTLHSETAWGPAGAGMSTVAVMPGFQKIPSVQQINTTSYRSIPDVAFHADPETGATIYSSIYGGYLVVGGTSVSTALFAGVVAVAVASRKAENKPPLTSVTNGVSLQNSLYKLMSNPTSSVLVLHDVVSGSAGEGGYAAGPHYDVATGLGSLDVKQFIDYIDAQ